MAKLTRVKRKASDLFFRPSAMKKAAVQQLTHILSHRPPRMSLIVALDQAKVESSFEAVRRLKDFTKRAAHLGAEADGALELVYMRGFQAGYSQALRDGRRARPAFALEPGRAEGQP